MTGSLLPVRTTRTNVLWLALVLLVAWLALGHARRAGRNEAALELQDSVVAVHAARADSLRLALEAHQRVTAAALAAGDLRARRHAARADAAEASAARLAGDLRPALPDSVRAAFDTLQALQTSALAAKDSVIAEREAQLALLVADTARTNQTLHAFHQAMHEALDQAEAWKRKARGPLVRIIWGPGAGVVLADGAVRAGAGVFVGLQFRP